MMGLCDNSAQQKQNTLRRAETDVFLSAMRHEWLADTISSCFSGRERKTLFKPALFKWETESILEFSANG